MYRGGRVSQRGGRLLESHVARYALWLYYRGDRFRGFQAQPEGDTVQQALERALSAVGLHGKPTPAGRTDRGVHARMQVVSFKGPDEKLDGLADRLRPHLPSGLGVCLARRARREFHAQWRTSGKEYRYRIAFAPVPGWEKAAWDIGREPSSRNITPERLAELLAKAQGTRDFWAFHEKTSTRTRRTLHKASLAEIAPGLFEARFVGDRFARYQVRYLVGTAVAVAAGAISEEAYAAALESANEIARYKAPPEGLTLWEVFYPPAIDPFTATERAVAPGLPREPPWQA